MTMDNEEFWEELDRLAEKQLKEAKKAFKRAVVALIVSSVSLIGTIACVLIRIFIS